MMSTVSLPFRQGIDASRAISGRHTPGCEDASVFMDPDRVDHSRPLDEEKTLSGRIMASMLQRRPPAPSKTMRRNMHQARICTALAAIFAAGLFSPAPLAALPASAQIMRSRNGQPQSVLVNPARTQQQAYTAASRGGSLSMVDSMIPANEGRITHMALTFGMTGGLVRENYMDAFKTFLSRMPDARFTVLTSNQSEQKWLQYMVDQWAYDGSIRNPARIHIVNSGEPISFWAQDSTLVMGNRVIEQERVMLPGVGGPGDRTVASAIARANPELSYERLEGIFIDGGNQLATRDTIFIGSDAITFMMKDMRAFPGKYQEISARHHMPPPSSMGMEEWSRAFLARTFPRQKVTIIGHNGLQPAFHIDMAMTPLGKPDPATGKPVILVGDPSMGVKMLRDLKARAPGKYRAYQEMVAEKAGARGSAPLDSLMGAAGAAGERQQSFDATAVKLENQGYRVERVPCLGTTSLARKAPWITYNNSVVNGDDVFIPHFGIPELDNYADGIYRKYGYTPVPIDMTAISSVSGAINCMTRVLERQYA